MSDNDRKNIIDAITRMLARREHAQQEILLKLQQKGYSSSQSSAILAEFTEAGIQSDARYAEARVRSAVSKGIGFTRLSAECQQLGIDKALLHNALQDEPVDWFELARQVRRKRFGGAPAGDRKTREKQMRFLYYRGFDQEQINYALSATDDEQSVYDRD